MFKHLFDPSFQRDFDEAVVFYYYYILLGFYTMCMIGILIDTFSDFYSYGFWVLLTPLFFFPGLSFFISLKKELKDREGTYLIIFTIILTLMSLLLLRIPVVGLFLWFFVGFFFSCAPVALLSMREDDSLKKLVHKMEQENLARARRVEKLLLDEQITSVKQNELKKVIKKDNNQIKD